MYCLAFKSVTPTFHGRLARFLRLSPKLIIVKYYSVDSGIYIPEPIAEYFEKCLSIKLPKRYYHITGNTIRLIDEERKISINVPTEQTKDVRDALLASAFDFYIALGVCTDSNTSLYRMIRKAREKVKEVLKIDDINLDPEFPICLKGGAK